MRVLIACEFSGTVRDAFIAKGHDAISCDIMPSETDGPHYIGDVRDIMNSGFDLMIAHPPCTYLANSGVRWLYRNGALETERCTRMVEAARFFVQLMNAPIAHICLENPIMHHYGREIIVTPYDQIIQPFQFGHAATKKTCLWLKNLPPLLYTNIHTSPLQNWAETKGGSHKGHERSRTFSGIARAMAQQWGDVK